MKRLVNHFLLLVIAITITSCTTKSQESNAQNFTFKFQEGQTMYYNINSIIDLDMDMHIAGTDMNTSMEIEMSYDIKLTADKISQNQNILSMTNENIEVHWDMSQAGSKIVMDMKDKEMYGTVDGEVFIDTKNGIGETESSQILADMQGIFESGTVVILDNGDVDKIEGSENFRNFWTEFMESSVGLLGIIFTQDKISVDDEWTTPFTIGNMGDINFEPPVTEDITFTRLDDKKIEGKTYQVFQGTSPFNLTDIQGTLNNGANGVTVNIDSFDRNATFDIIFDNEKGLLISNKSVIEGIAKMTTQVSGQEMDMDMVINGIIDIVHMDK